MAIHKISGAGHSAQRQHLGDPITHSQSKNCMNCKRWATCVDPKKMWNYACTKWDILAELDLQYTEKEMRAINRNNAAALAAESTPKDRINKLLEARADNDSDLEKMIDQALKEQVSGGISSSRVDDSDLKTPPNFWEWAENPHYAGEAGMKLWPRQIQMSMEFLGEYCPRCSDNEFMENLKVDEDVKEIKSRLQLLKRGKCPKCKATKSEFIAEGELNDYSTFTGVLGQRASKCVSFDSLVLTPKGLVPIQQMFIKQNADVDGYTEAQGYVIDENGDKKLYTHMYRSPKDRLIEIVTDSGREIIGTSQHRIASGYASALYETPTEWVYLGDNPLYADIPIYLGQNIWPKKPPVIIKSDSYAEWEANTDPRADQSFKGKFGKMTFELSRLLGWWTSEGTVGRMQITNHDPDMLDGIANDWAACFLSPPKYRTSVDISDRTNKCKLYFESLMPEQFNGKSAERVIPEIIMRSPKPIMSAFLSALFEGDGSAQGKTISYVSISKKLIDQLLIVLANYGIAAKARNPHWAVATTGTDGNGVWAYALDISSLTHLLRFQEHIGFLSERKQKALQGLIDRQQAGKQIPHWTDKYPEGMKKEFIEIFKTVGKELNKHSRSVDSAGGANRPYGMNSIFDRNSQVKRIYADDVALSRQRILFTFEPILKWASYLPTPLVDKIKKFITLAKNQDVVFDTVASVTVRKEPEYSYDLVIPDGHRFIANGILNHNTALSALMTSYMTARWLKVPNPQITYGTLQQQVFTATFVGLTFGQVRKNFWEPLNGYFLNSNWFREYHALLDHYQEKSGEELYIHKDIFLRYRHRNLFLEPSGPNKRVLRGSTRYISLCLTAGHMVATKERGLVDIADPSLKGLTAVVGGIETEIVRHLDNGVRPTVKITMDDGSTLRLTPDHPMLVWDSVKCKEVKREISRLKPTDYLIEDLSSGAFGSPQPSPTLTETRFTKKYEHIEVFERITSKEFKDGWFTYAATKSVPPQLFNETREAVVEFIAGIMDGDFSISPKVMTYSSTSFKMAKQIKLLLNMLGVSSVIKFYDWSTPEDVLGLRHTSEKVYAVANRMAKVQIREPSQLAKLISIIGDRSIKLNKSGVTAESVWDNRSLLSSKPSLIPIAPSLLSGIFKTLRLSVDPEVNAVFGLGKVGLKSANKLKRVRDLVGRPLAFRKVVSAVIKKPANVYDITVKHDSHVFRVNEFFSKNCDEAGWFPVGDKVDDMERMSGMEVNKALSNSMKTLNGAYRSLMRKGYHKVPKPMSVNISSPSEINDLIMTLYRDSQGSKTHYGVKLPTWEVNPSLPREEFDADFKSNPEKANRDFGANPPMSSAAWISDTQAIGDVFDGRPNNIKMKQYKFRSRSGVKQISSNATIKTKYNSNRLMAIDAGSVNNSFSVAVGRLDNDNRVVVESIGEVIPNNNMSVNFGSLYFDALLPIAREHGCQVLLTDRWQNIKMQNDLEQQTGIIPIEYRLKYQDFDSLRSDIYDGNVSLPRLEIPLETILKISAENYPSCFIGMPLAHLMYQIMTVRDFGNTVEKGASQTDDIFRCLALLHYGLTEPEIAGMLHDVKGPSRVAIGVTASLAGSATHTQNRLGASGAGAGIGKQGQAANGGGNVASRR
jgi:intein/homing endonuclease